MGDPAILLGPAVDYIRRSHHEHGWNILRTIVESTLWQRLDPRHCFSGSLGCNVLLDPILPLHL